MQKRIILMILLLFIVALLYFVLRSYTPAIKDKQGRIMPNSIASIEQVEINDTRQWIVMRGENKDNPILLWLDGGPGGTEIGFTRYYLSGLEKSFVFVNWDQRGTGKSFNAVKDKRDLKVEDYVTDIIQLTEYLRARFKQEKIYLVGHSWGSIIGLMAIERRPDLFYAYIGTGQQVNADENDIISYHVIMENARKAGDMNTVERLSEMGPPPYQGGERTGITIRGIKMSPYVYLFSKLFNYADTGNYNSMAMFGATEQSIIDKINMIRGLVYGIDLVYPQLVGINFEEDIPKVDVPVYFLTGRKDYTTSGDIAYRYYKKLEAPIKKFYWFENEGHNNCFEDNRKFMDILTKEILPETR